MKTISSSSHETLISGFWKDFLRALELLKDQGKIVIGLSGGTSFDIFYAHIKIHFHEIPRDIRAKIIFTFLDERIVPTDHGDSNEGQLRAKFLNALVEEGIIDGRQILGIPLCPSSRGTTRSSAPGDTEQDFSASLSLRSKGQERIDISLFGVGGDGHIASLFPHHPFLYSTEVGYLEITDSPKPPSHRVTVSPEMIRAMSFIFIAFMKGKEEAYANFCDENISFDECPAKLVQVCESLVVMREL